MNCIFAATEMVRRLKQSEATNDSVTIKWDPPIPLNSVVGYAVLVYNDDTYTNCRTAAILNCMACEVCELKYM